MGLPWNHTHSEGKDVLVRAHSPIHRLNISELQLHNDTLMGTGFPEERNQYFGVEEYGGVFESLGMCIDLFCTGVYFPLLECCAVAHGFSLLDR